MTDEVCFENVAAHTLAQRLARAPIWAERPMTLTKPYRDHIMRLGWHELCCLSTRLGNMRLTQEFFANLPFARGSIVFVRGGHVNFSPDTINDMFSINPLDADQAYSNEFTQNLNYAELSATVLKGTEVLVPETQGVRHESLTDEAWTWYLFIKARLIPQLGNQNVTMEQLTLIYAILQGHSINPGRIIHDSIMNSVTTLEHNPTLFFPSIIRKLCAAAGVNT